MKANVKFWHLTVVRIIKYSHLHTSLRTWNKIWEIKSVWSIYFSGSVSKCYSYCRLFTIIHKKTSDLPEVYAICLPGIANIPNCGVPSLSRGKLMVKKTSVLYILSDEIWLVYYRINGINIYNQTDMSFKWKWLCF